MLRTVRLALVVAALSGLPAAGGLAAGPERAEPAAGERAAGAEVDAFLEPWRRLRMPRLIPDHGRTCVPVAVRAPATAAQRELAGALAMLAVSPVGAWLIAEATARRVIVCRDSATGLAAYYRGQMRLVGVLDRLAAPAKVTFLAHELAHVPQHPHFGNDRRLGPRSLLVLQRLREAAAEAIATRALWQLRERGARAPWEHKLRSGFADIARVFAAAMAGSRGEAAELRATRAAFEQWFARPARRDQYDDHILNHLERRARDASLVPPARALSDDLLRGLGRHAGTTFLPVGGLPLTSRRYADGLSAANAARLAAVVAPAEPPATPAEERGR
jgi:hypothetical protein